jgi:hypothetical protein
MNPFKRKRSIDQYFDMSEHETKEANECLDRLEKKFGKLKLEMPFSIALALMTQISLALKHPQNKSRTADAARNWLVSLVDILANHEPALGRFLRAAYKIQPTGGGK